MPKTWKDQHSVACSCKACAAKPTFTAKPRPVLGSLKGVAPSLVEWQAPKPLPLGLLKCDEITPDSIFDETEPAPGPTGLEIDADIGWESAGADDTPAFWAAVDAAAWLPSDIWADVHQGLALLAGAGNNHLSGVSFGFTELPPPDVDLIDSSNPFARALDAWQTGKAAWTKNVLHRKVDDEERIPA